ncbi:hypothetical protein BV923_12015 [Pectobacterium odoriferum]|uniref:hypothetical protein n=1 Tax=Pectobacterium odoriferum TaxID=78398 RepID=UPI000CD18E87|nr:hypothetical protein [Pectobacterium odoriferum]POE22189.1 hypothetical protein BV923_12015 [Pectobacterium odoriferum]
MLTEDRFIEKLIEIISDSSISDYKGRIFNILKDFKSDYLIQLARKNGLKDRVNARQFIFDAIEFVNKKNEEQNLGGNPLRRAKYDKEIINLSEPYETKSLIKKIGIR